MKLSEFEYRLPERLIAQYPAARRDDSRLMVIDRSRGEIRHLRFRELPALIRRHDLLVVNNSRVFPARLFGHRPGRREQIEILLLQEIEPDVWRVLARPGRNLAPGACLQFRDQEFAAEVLEGSFEAERLLRFRYRGDFWQWLNLLGRVPLPPYIRRNFDESDELDRKRYQTVFAQPVGSVAAPTAGLHFTGPLLKKLNWVEITLHVGYGTFKPIHAERVEEHRMAAERYEIGADAAARIEEQLQSGRRVIAVGTTTTRTLEYVFRRHGKITADRGWTDLYIYPGFEFRVVGGLITNLHLPGSTLLLLVSAFAGKELTQEAYRQAVEMEYRFYSYGDAMLIL